MSTTTRSPFLIFLSEAFPCGRAALSPAAGEWFQFYGRSLFLEPEKSVVRNKIAFKGERAGLLGINNAGYGVERLCINLYPAALYLVPCLRGVPRIGQEELIACRYQQVGARPAETREVTDVVHIRDEHGGDARGPARLPIPSYPAAEISPCYSASSFRAFTAAFFQKMA